MHTNDENAFFVGEINKALFDGKRNHGAEIGALKTKKKHAEIKTPSVMRVTYCNLIKYRL